MDDSAPKPVRKRHQRSKYNKLTDDQKLEILRYWGETRESVSYLTKLFSNKWGMNLSYRGITEIIKNWREEGKIRGSKLIFSCHDVIPELLNIDRVAAYHHVILTEEDLRLFLHYISKMQAEPLEGFEMAFLQHICSEIAFHRSVSSPVFCRQGYSIPIDFLPSILSPYSPEHIYEIDSIDFMEDLFPCSRDEYSPRLYSSIQIWTGLAKDGSSPCDPCFFSVSNDPLIKCPSFSTIKDYHKLIFEAKCFAVALLRLDAACDRAGVVMYCDLQGLVVDTYTSQTDQVVVLRCVSTPSTSSITLHNLQLLVVSHEVALSVLPMYRGLQPLFHLLLKLSVVTNPGQHTASRIEETWKKILEYGSLPWGDCITEENSIEMEQLPPSIVEEYTKKYNEYVEQNCSVDKDVVTADMFLNAEVNPFYTGMRSIYGKAHTVKTLKSSGPIVESTTSQTTCQVVEPSKSESGSMDYSLFFDVYKSILTYLPTTQPKDYEAMERVKNVLLRKYGV